MLEHLGRKGRGSRRKSSTINKWVLYVSLERNSEPEGAKVSRTMNRDVVLVLSFVCSSVSAQLIV